MARNERPPAEGSYQDYRTWWKVFNDPTLDRLIETAYRENLNLRVAGVRVLAARAQLGIATGQLYPQPNKPPAAPKGARQRRDPYHRRFIVFRRP